MREAADAMFEFIRMPDSTGFGNFTESGQVVPAIDGSTESSVRRQLVGYEIKNINLENKSSALSRVSVANDFDARVLQIEQPEECCTFGRYVCYWHIADSSAAPQNVRFKR